MFKKIRIFILLLILATVALGSWRARQHLTEWEHTVNVAIYPISGDQSLVANRYVAGLTHDNFSGIESWVQEETRRYGKNLLKPVAIRLMPPLSALPPMPPHRPGIFDSILWSLRFRWWAWRNDGDGPSARIRLFVLYHDPETHPVLPHSTGLKEGGIGLLHVFASRIQDRQNAVIIAHEMLHVFGASDKYDMSSLQPIYPEGFAEPGRQPRYPQAWSEIMGGRRPLAADRSEIPLGLHQTLIGPATAREIGLTPAAKH